MIGNSTIQLSSVCPASVSPSSSFIANSISSANFCLYLQSKPQKKRLLRARASSPPPSSDSLDSNNNPLSIALDVPRALWRQTLRPLSDFGFGRRSVWEGAVGLFIVSGTILLLLTVAWLRAFLVRSKLRKYLAVFEFSQASGICTGTPVRIRGVTVGNVIRVNPSLKNIEALVEVEDDKIIIPKNSLVEVNQSGLLMETQIDITPKNPIPSPSFGPLDANCIQEDLILCDRQKMQGYQGVSLDELVGIFTRIGRESELIGIANTYSLAERVSDVIIEARPLLTKMQTMAEDIEPLLSQVRHRSLLREVETLTKSLTLASEDLRRVQSAILTPENTELIRKSIYTLIVTLENIENVSSDILGFTGDEATRRNLKLLIKSLSRLL